MVIFCFIFLKISKDYGKIITIKGVFALSKIYFDNSATTPIYDEALKEYINISKTCYENPSSLHSGGLAAEKILNNARKIIADSFYANEDEIIFTSGGTESDNIAILGTAFARERAGKHLITSRIEHHAVLNTFEFLEKRGFEVTYIDADENGIINLEQLAGAVRNDTTLISIMLVNNETGCVQPVSKIKAVAKNAYIHTDAVQAYGKVDFKDLNADLISVSAHKIHGPKGVGALYIKKGTKINNIVFGGGQEFNMRSGTQNTPAISAFSKSVQIMQENKNNDLKYISCLVEYFKEKLSKNIDDICFNGKSTTNILNVSFSGIRGEVLMHFLAEKGIYVSTGSACNSKSTKISYVLESMGIERNLAEGAVRFSFSYKNTKKEVDFAVEQIKEGVTFLRRFKRR